MGFFRRQEPSISFSPSSRMPKLIFSNGEWRLFSDAMIEDWVTIAGTAWDGYQTTGRGYVVVEFHDQYVRYFPAAAPRIHENRDRDVRNIRRQCARYKPDRENVLVIVGARDDKAARDMKLETFYDTITTPKGLPTPPQAYDAGAVSALRE